MSFSILCWIVGWVPKNVAHEAAQKADAQVFSWVMIFFASIFFVFFLYKAITNEIAFQKKTKEYRKRVEELEKLRDAAERSWLESKRALEKAVIEAAFDYAKAYQKTTGLEKILPNDELVVFLDSTSLDVLIEFRTNLINEIAERMASSVEAQKNGTADSDLIDFRVMTGVKMITLYHVANRIQYLEH